MAAERPVFIFWMGPALTAGPVLPGKKGPCDALRAASTAQASRPAPAWTQLQPCRDKGPRGILAGAAQTPATAARDCGGGPGMGCTGAPPGGLGWAELEGDRGREARAPTGPEEGGPATRWTRACPFTCSARGICGLPEGHAPHRSPSVLTSARQHRLLQTPPCPPHRELPREGLLAPSAPPPRLLRSRAQHRYLEDAQKC